MTPSTFRADVLAGKRILITGVALAWARSWRASS